LYSPAAGHLAEPSKESETVPDSDQGTHIALVAVDAALCSRSGVCSSIAPQIFASERDQATTVLRSTIRYGDVEVAQEAEAECPARAITVEIVDA